MQKQLSLQISQFEILRSYGRYLHAKHTEEMKCPILLPRHEHLTILVIQDIHRCLVHAGVSHTLSQVQQEYWISQRRASVKHVAANCTICKCHNGPSPICLLGPRRVSRSTPFEYVGLQYLGLVWVKEGGG